MAESCIVVIEGRGRIGREKLVDHKDVSCWLRWRQTLNEMGACREVDSAEIVSPMNRRSEGDWDSDHWLSQTGH